MNLKIKNIDLKAFIFNRLIEIFAIGLFLLAILLSLAVMTYTPDDPNFIFSEGQKVVVLEDLVSTGGSSLAAVDILRKKKMEVLGMISIFNYISFYYFPGALYSPIISAPFLAIALRSISSKIVNSSNAPVLIIDNFNAVIVSELCLLYTSDAADE